MARSIKLPARIQQFLTNRVDDLFDSLKVKFLGPVVRNNKSLAFSYHPMKTLPALFESASNEEGVKPDLNTLDTLIGVAEGYLDANRERTKAKLLKETISAFDDAAKTGQEADLETILRNRLTNVLDEAQTNVQQIVEAETNTAKNMGVLDGVVMVNAAAGIEDPVVAFLVASRVSIDAPCEECVKLHCTNGMGSPPRLWKLSEVNKGYHKKGEEFPSISGLHPHCRCTMVTVLPGYGYAGTNKVRFIAPGHDEFSYQRRQSNE